MNPIHPRSPVARLAQEPGRYDFFQAVRLLERLAAAAGRAALGGDTAPEQEAVHLRVQPGLRFATGPVAKVADLRAAAAFLAERPEVDTGRIAVLGICMGGNTAMHAAADDPLIRAVAAVTPHVRNAEADARPLITFLNALNEVLQ